jgi:hypothetical protein
MDLVSTVTNAVVVGAVGAILGAMVRGPRGQVRGDIAELRREMGGVRSDLTRVAVVVGAHPKVQRGR